ncbi:MAG: hypothetical protein ACI3ZL_09555 [Candidatus Cryptobacteroides sp.]
MKLPTGNAVKWHRRNASALRFLVAALARNDSSDWRDGGCLNRFLRFLVAALARNDRVNVISNEVRNPRVRTEEGRRDKSVGLPL